MKTHRFGAPGEEKPGLLLGRHPDRRFCIWRGLTESSLAGTGSNASPHGQRRRARARPRVAEHVRWAAPTRARARECA